MNQKLIEEYQELDKVNSLIQEEIIARLKKFGPAITWGDIKKAVNQMNESELSQQLLIWGEEGACKIVELLQTTEDFVNPDDEGSYAKSIYDALDPEDKQEEEPETSIPAGTLILYTNSLIS